MKLQDAFVSENGDFVGNFGKIGYEMGDTQTFQYIDGVSGTDGTTAVASIASAWKAKSKVALNDCTSGTEWQLDLDKSTSGNGLKWVAKYSAGESKCSILTPRFKDLTRGS